MNVSDIIRSLQNDKWSKDGKWLILYGVVKSMAININLEKYSVHKSYTINHSNFS